MKQKETNRKSTLEKTLFNVFVVASYLKKFLCQLCGSNLLLVFIKLKE